MSIKGGIMYTKCSDFTIPHDDKYNIPSNTPFSIKFDFNPDVVGGTLLDKGEGQADAISVEWWFSDSIFITCSPLGFNNTRSSNRPDIGKWNSVNIYRDIANDIYINLNGVVTLLGNSDGAIINTSPITFGSYHYQNTEYSEFSFAGHIKNAYWNAYGTALTTDAHGVAITNANPNVDAHGVKFHTNTASTLKQVNFFSANVGLTRCQLLDSGANVIDTTTVTNNVALFSYPLADATDYYVVADNNGSNFTRGYALAPSSYPYNRTNINFTAGWEAGDTFDYIFEVESITTSASSGSMSVNKIDLDLTEVKSKKDFVNSSCYLYSATITDDLSNMIPDKFTPATDYYGVKIHTNKACRLFNVYVDNRCTADELFVYDDGRYFVASFPINGHKAYVGWNFMLNDDTDYYLAVGYQGGDQYTQAFQDTPNTPVAGTNINYVEGGYMPSGQSQGQPRPWTSDNRIFNIVKIETYTQ